VFFDKLSLRQKSALLGLAKRMMIADALVRVEEDALYTVLKSELGPGVDAPSDYVFGEIDVSPFDDPFSQMVLVLTLSVMAYVDDNFHHSESSVLDEVKSKLNFSEDDLRIMMDIAERQGALIKDVQALFVRIC
jgi:hypothetical protein